MKFGGLFNGENMNSIQISNGAWYTRKTSITDSEMDAIKTYAAGFEQIPDNINEAAAAVLEQEDGPLYMNFVNKLVDFVFFGGAKTATKLNLFKIFLATCKLQKELQQDPPNHENLKKIGEDLYQFKFSLESLISNGATVYIDVETNINQESAFQISIETNDGAVQKFDFSTARGLTESWKHYGFELRVFGCSADKILQKNALTTIQLINDQVKQFGASLKPGQQPEVNLHMYKVFVSNMQGLVKDLNHYLNLINAGHGSNNSNEFHKLVKFGTLINGETILKFKCAGNNYSLPVSSNSKVQEYLKLLFAANDQQKNKEMLLRFNGYLTDHLIPTGRAVSKRSENRNANVSKYETGMKDKFFHLNTLLGQKSSVSNQRLQRNSKSLMQTLAYIHQNRPDICASRLFVRKGEDGKLHLGVRHMLFNGGTEERIILEDAHPSFAGRITVASDISGSDSVELSENWLSEKTGLVVDIDQQILTDAIGRQNINEPPPTSSLGVVVEEVSKAMDVVGKTMDEVSEKLASMTVPIKELRLNPAGSRAAYLDKLAGVEVGPALTKVRRSTRTSRIESWLPKSGTGSAKTGSQPKKSAPVDTSTASATKTKPDTLLARSSGHVQTMSQDKGATSAQSRLWNRYVTPLFAGEAFVPVDPEKTVIVDA